MKIFTLLTVAIFFCFLCGCSMHHVHNAPINDSETTQKKYAQTNLFYKTIKVGSSPLSPVAADFNQDGFKDIAVITHGESKLKIFWGGPERSFRKGPVYGKDMIGYHPGKIVSVDWNHDGLKDIIIACEGIFEVQLWENTGSGFKKKASQKIPINALSIKSADLDGDGLLDLVVTPHKGNIVGVLWGKKGGFSFDLQTIRANQMARNIEIGNWNHDARPDLFWVEAVPGSVVVAINKGKREFSKYYLKNPGKPVGLVNDAPVYVKTADLNGDGCEDAAVTFEVLREQGCTIFHGNCHGQVTSKEFIEAPEWGFRGLAVTVKQNGASPLIALGEEGRIFIAQRLDSKWFLVEKPAGSLPRDLSFADLDNDGNLDLFFANGASDTIGVLFGPLATLGQNSTPGYQK